MSVGAVALVGLALAILLSITTQLNIGLVSIALAWIIGVYLGGMSAGEVAAGFPATLFVTLAGVTLLFSQAKVNGTLEWVAARAVGLCRGNLGLVPILYFLLGAGLATAGPGNIATVGLLAPMAMATAVRTRVPLFLMAIMVGNGSNAGSLSPIAPTGIIVNDIMERLGLDGLEFQTWFYNFLGHAIVAFSAYFVLGGLKLFRRHERLEDTVAEVPPLERQHLTTLIVIGLLIAGVLVWDLNIGLAAFAAAVVLALLRAADHEPAIRTMPWGTILMVTGVTVLISLLERTAGMEIFTDALATVASRETIIPFVAGTVGLISAYASTSGVVLPAFLPIVPGLDESLGGGLAEALAQTMNVGGHLVDVSPLSTIGALCVASVAAGPESKRLFNQLLAWGLSMTVVGAVICWALFG